MVYILPAWFKFYTRPGIIVRGVMWGHLLAGLTPKGYFCVGKILPAGWFYTRVGKIIPAWV